MTRIADRCAAVPLDRIAFQLTALYSGPAIIIPFPNVLWLSSHALSAIRRSREPASNRVTLLPNAVR